MGAFYWSTTADYSATNRTAWGLTGGTFFYLPSIPSTDWDTTPDYTFEQQDLWFSKLSGRACDPYDFKGVAEAPEDYDILPTSVDITPPETQVDNESWEDVEGQNQRPGEGWTLITDE